MSKQSYRLTNRAKHQSDQESLPQQRFLQKGNGVRYKTDYSFFRQIQSNYRSALKKYRKNQTIMHLLLQDQELSQLKKQYILQVEQLRKGQNFSQNEGQREAELENIRNELQQLHNFTKKIQKKNSQMFKDLKHGNNLSNLEDLVQEKLQLSIEKKLDKHYKKSKQYMDQAVAQLKNLIKEYAQQLQKQNKITYPINNQSRSQSKNKSSNRRSSHSIKASQIKTQIIKPFTQTSFDDKSKCKSPKSIQNNSSSRVNYLREKLKQFQEINKKYQQKTDKKPPYKQEQKYTIQKMKDFKNYLQQSESEIQQSNLEIKQDNVLTDSIKKWRSGDKFRYQ